MNFRNKQGIHHLWPRDCQQQLLCKKVGGLVLSASGAAVLAGSYVWTGEEPMP